MCCSLFFLLGFELVGGAVGLTFWHKCDRMELFPEKGQYFDGFLEGGFLFWGKVGFGEEAGEFGGEGGGVYGLDDF